MIDVKAKKSLGQNFLTSTSIVEKIVEEAGITNKDIVIEIGPGLGILTNELCKTAKKVKAIEIDSSLIPKLQQNLHHENLEIINADALTFIPTEKTYKIVANIPYYITSPLITHFLTLENPPSTMTIMVQKEVADKICDKKNSILSLQIHLYSTSKIVLRVHRGSFVPMPKVDSAVIHLKLLTKANRAKNPEKILSLAKQAFSQKRKKLSNTLRHILPILKALHFEDLRPEHLSIQDWGKISAQM